MRTLLQSDYGMLFVLLLLAAFFGVVTYAEQHPTGAAAAKNLAAKIRNEEGARARVLIVVRDSLKDAAFAARLSQLLAANEVFVVGLVQGEPSAAFRTIDKLARDGASISVIACNRASSHWTIFGRLAQAHPTLKSARVVRPDTYSWPNFLKADNLLNVANQIAVIAIMAIGMTMVIIAGGIDLSVGSLVALSAVLAALLIRDCAGGVDASDLDVVLCSLAAIFVCGGAGLCSGIMVTQFRVPAFIVTLSVMLMASGLAYQLSEGQSINQVPDTYSWLGVGRDLFGIPNAVVLMILLYGIAHVVMTRMTLGRYIYAVGGNAEAARLSGVPVARVLWIVFTLCGLLAGLGGVMLASQLKSGSPTYGQMYELVVIAAVVVGGTSLAGGKGKIFGTLIGAFILGVIQNGMNLTGVEPYTQKVVLGGVILGAVLLDRLRLRGGGKG